MTKSLEKLLNSPNKLEVVGMADNGDTQFQISETEFVNVNVRKIFKEVKQLLKNK